MSKNIWYEVFIDFGNETRTIQSFTNLKDAKIFKRKLSKTKSIYLDGNIIDFDTKTLIHIDKWTNPENPKIIKSIE